MSLSRKQNLVLPLLVQGMTLEEISKKMGITRQTLHAWIKNDEFTAQLELERNRIR